MSAHGITSITYLPDFGDNVSPARVNRRTGELYINMSRWKDIQAEHRLFILLHELAHVLLDSSDEYAVDQLAFAMYARLGYSLKEGVRALTTVLSGNNPGHVERAVRQLERAKLYDYSVYHNKAVYSADFETLINQKKMCGTNKKCIGCTGCRSGDIPVIMADLYGDYDDYTGCQPGEKPRRCRRRIRTESKAAARENRSEGKRLKGQARAALADQGISEKSIAKGAFLENLKAGGKAVKGLLGKGGGEDGGEEKPKKQNWIPWAIGGGAAVVISLILVIALKKR